MRCCPLIQVTYQPVCLAPVYICPTVSADICVTDCSEPRVVSDDGCTCVVEQTFTVRVPVRVEANVSVGATRIFCVRKGERIHELSVPAHRCVRHER